MVASQEIIHKLEVGGGLRHFRVGIAVVALVCFVAFYDWRAYKNFDSREAMDVAQEGRNLAQGKGFTTLFVRPLSIYLVKKHYLDQHGLPPIGETVDTAQLHGDHPDLANPPVYPLVLAGLMKVLPFHYALAGPSAGESGRSGGFSRYGPDVIIALFNQLLLLTLAAFVVLLARRLFDESVGWFSGLVLLGTDLFWQFSLSGLSTLLLLVIFTGLVWLLVMLEQEAREPGERSNRLLVLAILIGLLTGVGAMTRYSFGWLIIPVLAFLLLFGGQQRIPLAALMLSAFVLAIIPWVIRNYLISGTFFGTAGYTLMESFYAGNVLQRTLDPVLSQFGVLALARGLWGKLIGNLQLIIQSDLPKLGGSWVTALFLVGLLVNFRSVAIKRLRWFLVMSLLVLCVVQALGRTQLSEEWPDLNSENLLVLTAPCLLIFGVSLFLTLLDQIQLPARELRPIALGLFGVLACLPILITLLHRGNRAAPPGLQYDSSAIPQAVAPFKTGELTMSNIPWAIAWYGQRQCVWWTLGCLPHPKAPDAHENFLAIHDYLKPVSLVYLVPEPLQGDGLIHAMMTGQQSWDFLILYTELSQQPPATFPLHAMQPGAWPRQIVLADWGRWPKPATH